MKNNSIWKKKIAGFTLAEVALATTIAMIGTSSALYAKQESLRSDIGRSQGEQLARFSNALDLYQREYYTAISNNQPIAYKVGTGTVANRLAPTFADLQGLALVDAASTPVSMFGADYVFTVSRAPAGCVAGTCVLTSTVHIPTPILEPISGGVDGVVIGEALIAGQGLVGTNDPTAPGTIRGFRNAWNMPNPIAGNPEGILMAQVSYGATLDAYLRRDGSTPMLGQLNMNGNPVTGATNIDATGAVTADSISVQSATIAGNLSANQVTATTGSFSGNLTLASATVTGDLSVAGGVTAGSLSAIGPTGAVRGANVVVEGVSTSGQSCTTNGQMRRTATGSILVCQSGTFKAVASGNAKPWTMEFVGTCRTSQPDPFGNFGFPWSACIQNNGSIRITGIAGPNITVDVLDTPIGFLPLFKTVSNPCGRVDQFTQASAIIDLEGNYTGWQLIRNTSPADTICNGG